MDELILFVQTPTGAAFAGVAIGAIVLWVFLRKKHHEKIDLITSQYNNEMDKLKSEYLDKVQWLQERTEKKEEELKSLSVRREIEFNELIDNGKSQCNQILSKAIDYAFDFKQEFTDQHLTAQKDIQKVLDDTYRYKRKTLLASVSLKNYERKLSDMEKEREIYKGLIVKYKFFALSDNSDWSAVEKEFRRKIFELQAAQEEKEHQSELKRQMREEQQRTEELERQQKEAEEKERELEERRKAIEEALILADEEHRKELEATRLELELEIEEAHKKYERAKSMAQLTKQGHVYIISNLGSFGENVFKIGMTRRLEPYDRISELSSASVPFEFDVHAMISCDDAPMLESKLHSELNKFRINKINLRKEFFKADISTIINCVEKNHGIVEYTANPAALQYLRSLEMEDENQEELVAS